MTRMALTACLSLAALYACVPASAQTEIIHQHYSTDNGLINNATSGILQDNRGFVWIATWDGLSRFDGYDFKNFKTGTESRVPHLHNRINFMTDDAHGNIWTLMYDQKLFRFNRRSEQFEGVAAKTPDGGEVCVKSILPVRNGDVWAVCCDYRILRIATDPITMDFSAKYHEVSAKEVFLLYEDQQSNIWAGTDKGAILLHPGGHPKYPVTGMTTPADCAVVSIHSGEGEVWFGSSDGRLFGYRLDRQSWREIDLPVRSPVRALLVDNTAGFLYVGTSGSGMGRLNIETGMYRTLGTGTGTIRSFFRDSHGMLWIYDAEPGILRYNPEDGSMKRFRHKVVIPEYYNGIEKVTEVNGVVWATLRGGGFGYYDRQQDTFEYFHNHPDDPRALPNVVPRYLVDPFNVIWMATHKRGIERITVVDQKIAQVYLEPGSERISDNELRAFCPDGPNLWAATKSGYLYLLDSALNRKMRFSTDDEGKPLGYIYSILRDPSGELWLGTKGNGLFRMTPTSDGEYRFEHFTNDPADPRSLNHNMVYSVIRDSRGLIWVGTFGGGVNLLTRDESGRIVFLSPDNGLNGYPGTSCRKVRALCEDFSGAIWAGTTEGTVRMEYDPEQKDISATVYRKEADDRRSVPSNDIKSVYRDAGGDIWLATVGGGVARYARDQSASPGFTAYTTEQGLPSNDINSLTEDRDRKIWFSTEAELCMLDPENGMVSVFSRPEGIGMTMFSETTALTLPDGQIIFGSVNGIYRLDKTLFAPTDNHRIRLEITDFQLNDEFISPRDGDILPVSASELTALELPNRHVVFGFQYASLNYASQHRVHYRHKLEGYDTDWIDDGGNRKAVYADIPHGRYIFRVRAFLPERPDIFDEKVIELKILPFIWETQGAFAAYAAFIGLLAAGIWYYIRRKRLHIKGLRVFKIGPSEIVLNDEGDQKFLAAIMEWLEKNYANPDLLIDEMVTPSRMSRSSFYNRLKLLTQMSPVELLNDFRMKKAEMYLRDTNLSIGEIAYKTGFNDPAYFTRIFKTRQGATPSQYRKSTSKHYSEGD